MAIPVVLIVFLAISTLFTPPCTADSVLYPGDRLTTDQSMITGDYVLTMEDCNLVLYDNYKQVWKSETRGKGSYCYALLSTNGSFAIYNYYTNETVWIAEIAKQTDVKSCVLILQRDGHVAVYCGPLWSEPNGKLEFGRKMGIGNSVKPGPKALGRKMGIGNGGRDIHRAFVLVNSEGETELGSMITQVVNE